MKKVLLYSGGLDSWLIDKLWKPDVKVYVDIHGGYNEAEIARLPDDVVVVDFSLLGQFEMSNRFVPMRNLYFLMIGSHYGDTVCLGATAGDWGNKDKTPEFLEETEHILKELWDDKKCRKNISVEKSFVTRYKTELLREYLTRGGTIAKVKEETFSCYTPIGGEECYSCYPCFRKFAILCANGYQYPEETERKMWEYVKRNIIPTKKEGGYQGTYYTDRGEESKDLVAAVNYLKNKYDNSD